MIWLVWDSHGETEADAIRISAQDGLEAAEEWARRDSMADPGNYDHHLRHGLYLRARLDGAPTIYRVRVDVEVVIEYHASAGGAERS